MLLKEALQIPFSARCICAVGAGGKTSLLYRLAEEYRKEGKRVLLTTTTKMRLPEWDGIVDGTENEILEKMKRDGLAIAGVSLPDEKMGPLPEGMKKNIFFAADIVLVEADGSREMPLKMPRKGEPVLPEECDFLVIVAGLSSLGKSWREVCHRFALISDRISEESVSEKRIAWLLEEGYGRFWKQYPCCVFLNQADSVGWRRAEKTAEQFFVPCAWGSLWENEFRRREEPFYEGSIHTII